MIKRFIRPELRDGCDAARAPWTIDMAVHEAIEDLDAKMHECLDAIRRVLKPRRYCIWTL